MSEIKVSVIIPIYNVEKYIEQCMESVVNQTLKDIEIIIVNDGTKDNSMKIIEKYLSDSRVIVINKENGGLSSARNTGLKIANGEYIYFIDSDDFIELTMLEELYNNSEKADIVFSDIIFYDDKTKSKKYSEIKLSFEKKLDKGSYFLDTIPIVVWNKIYRNEYLKKLGLTFIEGIIYEDNDFTVKAVFQANKVKYVKNFHYYYRINRDGSIMANSKKWKEEKKNKEGNLLKINSQKAVIEDIEKFYQELEKIINSYEKIILKLFELDYIVELLEISKDSYSLSEAVKKFEKILKENWNLLSLKEKKAIKIKLNKVLNKLVKQGNQDYIKIFDLFYWKNKIFTKKLLRRFIERKIRKIFN